jgi:hypothetical protein
LLRGIQFQYSSLAISHQLFKSSNTVDVLMSADEANRESLECARYGEVDDLRGMFVTYGADPNYADENGNTALHRAAANGEVECLKVLKEFNAPHKQNAEGNFPIHWAALNGQAGALKFIIENYDVDMLIQNGAGRSTLSEAFQSQKPEVIEICLSHPSASEDKLLDTNDGKTKIVFEDDADGSAAEKHAVTHLMDFTPASDTDSGLERRLLRVRELPITRADNPFGSETRPEDDTTGNYAFLHPSRCLNYICIHNFPYVYSLHVNNTPMRFCFLCRFHFACLAN